MRLERSERRLDHHSEIEGRSTLVQRTAASLDEASACGEWAEVDRVYLRRRMSIWVVSLLFLYILISKRRIALLF